jgi:hypothetical protein
MSAPRRKTDGEAPLMSNVPDGWAILLGIILAGFVLYRRML